MCHKTFSKWSHCISLSATGTWSHWKTSEPWMWLWTSNSSNIQGFIFIGLKDYTVVGNKTNIKQVSCGRIVLWYPILGCSVTSKKRCQSGPQKSVRYIEVSDIMCRWHRSFSIRIWLLLFHLFPRKYPLYGVSTITRFDYILLP